MHFSAKPKPLRSNDALCGGGSKYDGGGDGDDGGGDDGGDDGGGIIALLEVLVQLDLKRVHIIGSRVELKYVEDLMIVITLI